MDMIQILWDVTKQGRSQKNFEGVPTFSGQGVSRELFFKEKHNLFWELSSKHDLIVKKLILFFQKTGEGVNHEKNTLDTLLSRRFRIFST